MGEEMCCAHLMPSSPQQVPFVDVYRYPYIKHAKQCFHVAVVCLRRILSPYQWERLSSEHCTL
jgi:hypothetical protein